MIIINFFKKNWIGLIIGGVVGYLNITMKWIDFMVFNDYTIFGVVPYLIWVGGGAIIGAFIQDKFVR